MPRKPSDPPFWESIQEVCELAEMLPYELDYLDENDDGCIDALANAIWGMREVMRENDRMAKLYE